MLPMAASKGAPSLERTAAFHAKRRFSSKAATALGLGSSRCLRVHVVDETFVAPERVLDATRDFSERRAEMWPDVHVEHLEVHETGETFAEVTEGNPWPIGYVWERLRYEWSEPGSVKGVVTDSNIFKPGSTWEIRATPADGGSRVEVIGVRHLGGIKGRMLAPFFPLGLAKRTVADHLRHFLSYLEEEEAATP
jgi:hypothetical protein